MILREQPYMPALLVVHLALVLALFITLPYGKFVHGFTESAALIKFRRKSVVEAGSFFGPGSID